MNWTTDTEEAEMKDHDTVRTPDRRPRARWRLMAVLGAAGLLLAAALPSSASAQQARHSVVGGSKLIVGDQILTGDGARADFHIFWAGPNATQPAYQGTERIFRVLDRGAPSVVGSAGGSANCPFNTLGTIQWRCPSGGISTYQVNLESRRVGNDGFAGKVLLGGDIPGPMQSGKVQGSNARDQIISVWPTDDDIQGGGGNDLIRVAPFGPSDGSGNNVLKGGNGNDKIVAFENGTRDVVLCGRGFDTAQVDLQDAVSSSFSSCEVVQQAPKDKHPIVKVLGKKVKVAGGRAAIRLKCPKKATGKRCKGKLILKKGKKKGKKLGSARFSLKKGKKRTVRVRVGGRRGTARAIAKEGKKRNRKTSTKQLKLR